MRHVDYQGYLQDMIVLCLRYNGSVTSWIRSPKRNENVGGVPDSLHLVGLAVDVAFDTPEDKEDAHKFAKSMGYDVVPYSGHLHIEYDTHL